MKLLLIAFLTVAAISAPRARAIDWCSSGSLSTGIEVLASSPGSVETVSNCLVGAGTAVTYDAKQTPTNRVAPINLQVVNSVFGASATLRLRGRESYSEDIVNRTVCKFLVQGNAFNGGSMVYVTGVFSPQSSITIVNNQFTLGSPLGSQFPGATVNNFVSAIYADTMYLMDQVPFTIRGNRITGTNSASTVAVNAISFAKQLYYYGAGSSVDISDNTIAITCSGTGAQGTAIGGAGSMYIYAPNVKHLVEGNTVTTTGSSSAIQFPSVIASPGVSGTLSVSHNTVNANTAGMAAVDAATNYRPFMRFQTINIDQRAVGLWVSNNTLTATGALGSIGFGSDVVCGNGCAVHVTDNSLTTTDSDPRVVFMGEKFIFSGNGSFRLSGNQLSRSGASAASSPVYFHRNLRLNSASSAVVADNTFSAASPVKMVELGADAINTAARASDATLFACGNTFGGTVLTSVSQVQAVCTPAFGDLVMGADNCPAVTTAAPATTTATTTTGPSAAPTTIPTTTVAETATATETTTAGSGSPTDSSLSMASNTDDSSAEASATPPAITDATAPTAATTTEPLANGSPARAYAAVSAVVAAATALLLL